MTNSSSDSRFHTNDEETARTQLLFLLLIYAYYTLRSSMINKLKSANAKTALWGQLGGLQTQDSFTPNYAAQRDATQRATFSVNTLSSFNVFDYCGAT